MLISPRDVAGDLHRRCPADTRKGHYGIKDRDGQLADLRCCMDAPSQDHCELQREATKKDAEVGMLPFGQVKVLEVSGLRIVDRPSFQQHIEQTINKAKIRLGIMRRVLGSS